MEDDYDGACSEDIKEGYTEKEDLSVFTRKSCFVSLKNIPLSLIPESTQSLIDNNLECSSKYPSSVTLLPSSGPKDFLWQLDSSEFSQMLGLCTHSQADKIRAKPPGPSTMRLRRANQGNSVNYNVVGNAKKKRDQRKSIEL